MTGLRNPRVIECLVDAGFELSTVTAFIWAPVVFVAWADGNADHLERLVILKALPSKNVSIEAVSLLISHEWFSNPPTQELWNVWEEFAAGSLAGLSASEREAVIDEIIDLCYEVAHASGGFLGFGRISQCEQETIDRIIVSLNRPSVL